MSTLDPFALFCAYHLGLDRSGRFRFMNRHDVARDFGVDVDAIEAALHAHGLDAESVLAKDFDVAGAQLDMQLSPPGVDLVGVAMMHWDCFQQAGPALPDDDDGDDGDDNDGDAGRGDATDDVLVVRERPRD